MTEKSYKNVVIFGGSGSVGQAFIEHFVNDPLFSRQHNARIVIADLRKPTPLGYQTSLAEGLKDGYIKYVNLDVRKPEDLAKLPQDCDLIANFAAVHREPGHREHEYFDTNIRGAENVCHYADKASCSRIIFTSSISPYGPCSEPTTERSLTCPNTPYGSSKLAAEKIHEGWTANHQHKKLIIVRPGVLFGPGEGGNVGRMIQAIKRGMFFYCGNKKIVKAGGYIKELTNTMTWALNRIENLDHSVLLYNFSMNPPHSIEAYAEAIKVVLGERQRIRNIPYPFIFLAGLALTTILKPIGLKNAFSPQRLKKMISSNNVRPQVLVDLGYVFKFSLNDALRDWRRAEPTDWEIKNITEIEHESNFTGSIGST
jgi:nucleoside-diphosphate-sugar epimerase